METEQVVNLVLFAVLFIATAVGFIRGFIYQAIELVGAIAAFIIAILMSGAVADFLENQFQFPYSVALVIGFMALLLVGLVASRFLAMGISKVVKMTILRFVDRLAGAVLGLIFGMILCSLLISAVLELPFPYEFRRDVAGSEVSLFLRPIARDVFNWVMDHTPADIHYDDIFRRGNSV